MIHRTALRFDRDFTIMPNVWARDRRLSRKARGLLVELLSHQPGWAVSVATLVGAGTEGRDAVRSAIRELEEAGYLERIQQTGADGRFQSVDYALSDPSSENPTPDAPPPKKTIGKKTTSREEIRSLAQRPTHSSRFASEPQKEYLRDLIIHSTGETPSAEDEAWLADVSAADAWQTTRDMLSEMPRYDDYQGPPAGSAAFEELSAKGKLWADTSMLPEGAAIT
ncbi:MULTISPECIES: hypothetical protein [unclassified Microbacterium]|uniref:hypothetical protein n=1 Tax=unclassified Microbacterium TaxID=2609290 RepID=UPI003650C0C2